jgi:phosphoribosylaminoimidazole carboxylase PurK protein
MSEITRVGIVGDGQLGRMLAEANNAASLGLEITVLGTGSPDGPKSPAAQIPGVRQIYGESLYDEEALTRLVELNDVTTIEVEHVDAVTLYNLRNDGHNIQPSPESLFTIQNKYRQKKHLEDRGLPVARYTGFRGAVGLAHARAYLGQALMVKSATGAYDGRGNLLVPANMEWASVEEKFGKDNPNLYAEGLVSFQRELSVVGVRDMAGRIATYPVVQTIHQDNICHTVLAPAEIGSRAAREAEDLGRATIEAFDGAGVFAVEMFHDEDDRILINEVAPRVHNSGHWTIEGAETSQFENHLRAIAGLPLGSTQMVSGYDAAVMVNLLGTRTGELDGRIVTDMRVDGMLYPHWYGKTLRPARKVGHVTVLAANMPAAEDMAEVALEELEDLL